MPRLKETYVLRYCLQENYWVHMLLLSHQCYASGVVFWAFCLLIKRLRLLINFASIFCGLLIRLDKMNKYFFYFYPNITENTQKNTQGARLFWLLGFYLGYFFKKLVKYNFFTFQIRLVLTRRTNNLQKFDTKLTIANKIYNKDKTQRESTPTLFSLSKIVVEVPLATCFYFLFCFFLQHRSEIVYFLFVKNENNL